MTDPSLAPLMDVTVRVVPNIGTPAVDPGVCTICGVTVLPPPPPGMTVQPLLAAHTQLVMTAHRAVHTRGEEGEAT